MPLLRSYLFVPFRIREHRLALLWYLYYAIIKAYLSCLIFPPAVVKREPLVVVHD
jgi:hypothetical protein